MLFFAVTATGCATVDATVEKVKSGVSSRFDNNDKAEQQVVPEQKNPAQKNEQVREAEPAKPVKKPLLVDVQEKLRTMGYYSGPISGKLDSRTEAAIQDFQLDNDLRINGRPTKSLLTEINKVQKRQ